MTAVAFRQTVACQSEIIFGGHTENTGDIYNVAGLDNRCQIGKSLTGSIGGKTAVAVISIGRKIEILCLKISHCQSRHCGEH